MTSQSRENHAIRHVGVQLAIVLYLVVCRSKLSGMEWRLCHNSTNWNTSKIALTFSKTSIDILVTVV